MRFDRRLLLMLPLGFASGLPLALTLFRPELNARRFNESCERLCMPGLEETRFVELVKALVRCERDWVPASAESSLYLRPFLFATDELLGVRPSETYKFMVIACPAGAYYAKPVSVKIEERYTRAAEGVTGARSVTLETGLRF